MIIDPTWNTMLIRSINEHYSFYLQDQNGIKLEFPDQEALDYTKLDKWVELSMFGPFFELNENRDIEATLKVSLRVLIKKMKSIYEITDLTGMLAHVASVSIKMPDFNRCLENHGIVIIPKGRIMAPQTAVAAEVNVTYCFNFKE